MTKAYVAAWPDERTGAGGQAMNKLFCDLKTDEEKAEFFLSGRGHETGVIALSIQNDVAMAYHRCAEYKKELAALQAENDRLTRYYKNGIDCFANPCEEHSGERTPPFPEFFERYGGQCLICVVDNNKTLQAERDALLADRDRLKEALEAMLEIHGVTQRYADARIEIPQSWVDVSDLARAALALDRHGGEV